jgi:hypothetical protein
VQLAPDRNLNVLPSSPSGMRNPGRLAPVGPVDAFNATHE